MPRPDPSLPPGVTSVTSQQDGRRPRTVRSEDLLQGQVEVLIEHGADVYRLRLTRSGKLILQK